MPDFPPQEPFHEVFLVIQPLVGRDQDLPEVLRRLDEAIAGDCRGVDAFYRPGDDIALIAVRYHARDHGLRAGPLVETARTLRLPTLDPRTMNDSDRRMFYRTYLVSYELRIEGSASVLQAMVRLGRLARIPLLGALGSHRLGPSSTPPPRPSSPLPPLPRPRNAHVIRRTKSPAPGAQDFDEATRNLHRERGDSDPGSPSCIDVRFLRGGQWTLGRLRALSIKGAYLVTGAPPRVDDAVHVALGFGDHGALVRGTVYHVTSPADAQATGATGFAVKFDAAPTPHPQLVDLLTAARDAGVTIKPPPARGSRRLPLCWPMRIATSAGTFSAEALDASCTGFFVTTERILAAGDEVSFGLCLDDGDAPITGRGRIARSQRDAEPGARGLRPGYGVTITELDEPNRREWDRFLDRVKRRSELRVLVGAAASQVSELCAGLTALGYTVHSASDPGTMMRFLESEMRPPDLAVIDQSMSGDGPAGWLEQLLAARDVPLVAVRGDVLRTRCAVDRALRVAAA